MNIFKKIKIRKILKNNKTLYVDIDNNTIDKDILKYFNFILPKYGFVLIYENDLNGKGHIISHWCNKDRSKNSMAYEFDGIGCYADNEIVDKPKVVSRCYKCQYRLKCKGGDQNAQDRR